jgi:hypothetical protein
MEAEGKLIFNDVGEKLIAYPNYSPAVRSITIQTVQVSVWGCFG